MTNVTINELIDLRDGNNITAGETYCITDYTGGYLIYMVGISDNELDDESKDEFGRELLFDLDNASVLYLKDSTNHIEGYFDWSSNIQGNCSYICFENATNLTIRNSREVYVEDTCNGNIVGCSGITIGDGSTVGLNRCGGVSIGRDNEVYMDGCSRIDIADNNTITLNGNDGLSIGSGNSDLNIVNGRHIIGNSNKDITIDGDSCIIGYRSVDVSITGLCNEVNDSKYLYTNGDYNKVSESSLVTLNVSHANEVRCSGTVDVEYTNNNVVQSDDLSLDHKTAFVKFSKTGGVVKATDLAGRVNMQADCNGTVLIVDQEKFWNTSDTKSGNHYVLVDGVWTDVS